MGDLFYLFIANSNIVEIILKFDEIIDYILSLLDLGVFSFFVLTSYF